MESKPVSVGDNKLKALFAPYLLEFLSRPFVEGRLITVDGKQELVGDVIRAGIAGATTGMTQHAIDRLVRRLNGEVSYFVKSHARRSRVEALFIAFNIYQMFINDGSIPEPEGQLLEGVSAVLDVCADLPGDPKSLEGLASKYVRFLTKSNKLYYME